MFKKEPLSLKVHEVIYDDPVILPGNRWLVYCNFRLKDQSNKQSANIYLIICSSEYRKVPSDEEPLDADDRVMELEWLDKDKVNNFLENAIKALNDAKPFDWPTVYKMLEDKFSVDD